MCQGAQKEVICTVAQHQGEKFMAATECRREFTKDAVPVKILTNLMRTQTTILRENAEEQAIPKARKTIKERFKISMLKID